jgi:hypothetical protein
LSAKLKNESSLRKTIVDLTLKTNSFIIGSSVYCVLLAGTLDPLSDLDVCLNGVSPLKFVSRLRAIADVTVDIVCSTNDLCKVCVVYVIMNIYNQSDFTVV